MNSLYRYITLAVVLSGTVLNVGAEPCTRQISQSLGGEPLQGCHCGKALKNVVATLPPALTLVAACAVRWSNEDQIDIATKRITLDEYSSGNLPLGEFFLSGRLTLRGSLLYEPGPAGEYWFYPERPLIVKRTPLANELGGFKLAGDREPTALAIPARLQGKECLNADVKLQIDGVRLLIGQSGEAGAYPITYKVLHTSGFRVCSHR
jgi:hypothetical protein